MKANQHAPRILGGQYRGRVIQVPPGRGTRPLRALARRSLFDKLSPLLPGARVLDLFAGAGTVGLEAASRGAALVVLVEQGRPALEALRRSIHIFGAGPRVQVVAADVLHYLAGAALERFELIFLGPPYRLYQDRADNDLERVLDRVGALLAPDGTLVLEHPSNFQAPPVAGLTLVESRTYGDTALGFFNRQQNQKAQA